MTVEDEARAEAKRRGIAGEGFSTFAEGAVWQAGRPVVITDEMVERAARAFWVAEQPDQGWAAKVVDDMFSPPDDYTDECMKMLDQARAALEAALGQTATDTSRVLAILDAVIDAHKGEVGTHYDGCYKFHAGCLAVRIRHVLGHGSDGREQSNG